MNKTPLQKQPQQDKSNKADGITPTSSASSRVPLSKRLSFKQSGQKNGNEAQHMELSDPNIFSMNQNSVISVDEEEQDPLLALFHVHNTNRVKFDLTPKAKSNSTTSPETNQLKREGSKLFTVKRFVKSSLFSSSNATSVLRKESSLSLDEEDDIIQEMLDPPSPLFRRVSSFFTRNGTVNNNDNNYSWKQNLLNESHLHNQRPSNKMASKEIIPFYLQKAQRYHKKTIRYRLAMKYYLLALNEMQLAGYEDSDPLSSKVLKSLNDVHHAQSILTNSANIVKMGIQHEDKNQLAKALKMYTIAYRMRRDSLGIDHPSLPVLLNMIGSIQMKRGEFQEAMTMYELGLKSRTDEKDSSGSKTVFYRDPDPLTTSVTLRDMGMIFEHMGDEEKALRFHHASLKYALRFKRGKGALLNRANDEIDEDITSALDDAFDESVKRDSSKTSVDDQDSADPFLANIYGHIDEPFSLDRVRVVKCTSTDKSLAARTQGEQNLNANCESGEMELSFEKRFDRWALSQETTTTSKSIQFYYDELYTGESQKEQSARTTVDGNGAGQKAECSDIDIAMTLHQIGEIHRRNHRHTAALSAFNASVRCMKQVFGCEHAHIAAILGNIGNLHMETGDNDKAFAIYQEVLGIETLHFGLSHPEVAVTLYNIATIECNRGNFSEGVSLYKHVAEMQKIQFGQDHLTVASTLSCLADAYERMGNLDSAVETYEQALNIRTSTLANNHIDVGRLMHKLGRLATSKKDFVTALNHVKKAIEIYDFNVLPSDHLFMREIRRDHADIQAGLAFESSWRPHLDDYIDTLFNC